MVPSPETCTSLVRSGTLKTEMARTSSGPILYPLLPGLAAAVSLSAAADAFAMASGLLAAGVGAKASGSETEEVVPELLLKKLLLKEAPQLARPAAPTASSATATTRVVTLLAWRTFIERRTRFNICHP